MSGLPYSYAYSSCTFGASTALKVPTATGKVHGNVFTILNGFVDSNGGPVISGHLVNRERASLPGLGESHPVGDV